MNNKIIEEKKNSLMNEIKELEESIILYNKSYDQIQEQVIEIAKLSQNDELSNNERKNHFSELIDESEIVTDQLEKIKKTIQENNNKIELVDYHQNRINDLKDRLKTNPENNFLRDELSESQEKLLSLMNGYRIEKGTAIEEIENKISSILGENKEENINKEADIDNALDNIDVNGNEATIKEENINKEADIDNALDNIDVNENKATMKEDNQEEARKDKPKFIKKAIDWCKNHSTAVTGGVVALAAIIGIATLGVGAAALISTSGFTAAQLAALGVSGKLMSNKK